MKSGHWLFLLVIFASPIFASPSLTLGGPSATPPTAQPLATVPEIQTAMDSGDFKAALLAIKHILAKPDLAALGYDRHKILKLKAECELQSHDKPSLLATWTMIGREADLAAAIDDKAEALAMQSMLKKCSGFNYPPKTAADKTPIDIVATENRKRAFDALFADDCASFKQKLVNSKALTSLAPLTDVADSFSALQAEERIATGKNEQTKQYADQAVNWATNLIHSALVNWDGDLIRIGQRADEMVTVQVVNKRGKLVNKQQRRGLSDDDVARVQSMHDQSQDLPATINNLNLAFVHPIKFKGDEDFSEHALKIRDKSETLLQGGSIGDGTDAPAAPGGRPHCGGASPGGAGAAGG